LALIALLETDGFVSLPADAELRFVITAYRCFAQFCDTCISIKIDAIPGRLNQFGMKVASAWSIFWPVF
jgi:heme/copper-type cytochrome/quinol oxidase subunit 2